MNRTVNNYLALKIKNLKIICSSYALFPKPILSQQDTTGNKTLCFKANFIVANSLLNPLSQHAIYPNFKHNHVVFIMVVFCER